MSDLVRDETGKLTNCAKNRYLLGYWWTTYSSIDLSADYEEISSAISLGIYGVLCAVFYPVVILLRGWVRWRDAIRIMKLAKFNRVGGSE
jgi:hypothetical protein